MKKIANTIIIGETKRTVKLQLETPNFDVYLYIFNSSYPSPIGLSFTMMPGMSPKSMVLLGQLGIKEVVVYLTQNCSGPEHNSKSYLPNP